MVEVIEDLEVIWSRVQDELRDQTAKPNFDAWVARTVLLSQQEGSYTIGAPNKLACDWLAQRYASLVTEALQEVTGREARVRFVVTPGEEDSPRPNSAGLSSDAPSVAILPRRPVAPFREGSGAELNPRFRFSNFVVGNNSQLAHAAAVAVAEAPGEGYNPLFLYGGVGLGKTHLMHAIGQELLLRYPEKRVTYLTSEQFTNETIEAIEHRQMEEFRNKYRTVDLLLIDDIQFLAGKERTTEEFFHTFNALYSINKQVVISSDRAPKDISSLEDRLRSRFEWGLMADIQPPDFETRLAILKSKVATQPARIPEEVLSMVAHQIKNNIRELEGALNRLIAHTRVRGRELGVDEATQLLHDLIPTATKRKLTIPFIQEAVCAYYGISVDDIKGKRRDKQFVLPRQVAMFIIREETPSSLPQIGQAFGGRDHTTALHSIEKIANEIKEDPRLADDIREIRERLYGDV